MWKTCLASLVLVSTCLRERGVDSGRPRPQDLHLVREGAPAPKPKDFAPSCRPFPGKRIVLVTVTSDWMRYFRNWLHFAGPFLTSTEQLLVVAEDMEVVPLLQRFKLTAARAPFKIVIPTSKADQASWNMSASADRHGSGDFYKLDIEEDKPYSSTAYKEIVSQRPLQIKHFLDMDCSVLYVDIDSAWLKNPFDEIGRAGSYEMYVTDDSRQDWGLKSDVLCSCFLYMHPTINAWVVITDWAGLMAGEPDVNQAKFNKAFQTRLQYAPGFAVALPQREFPPGMDPIQKSPTVVHANGRLEDAKERYLKDHGAWSLD